MKFTALQIANWRQFAMSAQTHCSRCGETMSDADSRAESGQGDAMCISCRNHLAQCAEEEATASFCQDMPNPMADWFAALFAKSGFQFTCRIPSNINETCKVLEYENGKPGTMGLIFCASPPCAILAKRNHLWKDQPEWKIKFSLATPERIVLATIKAAVEEGK